MGEKKNIVLDASVLSTLMGCARLVDLRYNNRFIPLKGKSNSLEVGSVVHKFLEIYYKNIINGFSKSISLQHGMAAAEMYITGCKTCMDGTRTCNHQPDEYPGLKNTPPDSTTQPKRIGWKYALDTCQQYYDYYTNDHWVPLEVEVVKGEVLYEDDTIRVLWKSKLDWIADTNQAILPIDHKTGQARREMLSLNNQFIGQCLIMKTRTMIINHVGFQTTLKPADKFVREPISYSADRLIEWQSEILPYWAYRYLEYHESGYWPPNFTHCDTKYGPCVMRGICESDRGMREEEIKINFMIGAEWNPTNESTD